MRNKLANKMSRDDHKHGRLEQPPTTKKYNGGEGGGT